MKSGRWSSRKNPTQVLQTACYTSASMRYMTVASPLPSAAVAVIGAGAMGSGTAQLRRLDAAFPGGRYRPSPELRLRQSRRAQVGL